MPRGAIPAYFSAGFEARALKYQKTMIACQRWYDQQVRKHVDLTLAVLNKEDWESVSGPSFPYPMPYGQSLGDPVVLLPARFEDFSNSADFTDDVELLVENISYHEMGHLYAHILDMETDDAFLAEMYANFFMVAFVRAQRPDMLFFLAETSCQAAAAALHVARRSAVPWRRRGYDQLWLVPISSLPSH